MSPERATGPVSDIVHATCVAVENRGLLILGASGSGKSGLALQLMALGARLVSDDRVVLSVTGRKLTADAPDAIRGLIEARGLGLLRTKVQGEVPVSHVLDLDRTETERLPPERSITLLGVQVPLLYRVDALHFPAALVQLLSRGRRDDI